MFAFIINKSVTENIELNPRTYSRVSQSKLSLKKAAEAITLGKVSEAREVLLSILSKEPDNDYAKSLLLPLEPENRAAAEAEIVKVKAILDSQPNYRAAWEKLAYLYDDIGEKGLADAAREKADNLPY